MLYKFNKAVDSIHELDNGMRVFSGDLSVPIESTRSIEKDGESVSKFRMDSHMGTHIDTLAHFIRDGERIDQISASGRIGGTLAEIDGEQ